MSKLLQPLIKHLGSTQASQQAQALVHSSPIPFHALLLHERKLLGPLVQLLRHKVRYFTGPRRSVIGSLTLLRLHPVVSSPNFSNAELHVLRLLLAFAAFHFAGRWIAAAERVCAAGVLAQQPIGGT